LWHWSEKVLIIFVPRNNQVLATTDQASLDGSLHNQGWVLCALSILYQACNRVPNPSHDVIMMSDSSRRLHGDRLVNNGPNSPIGNCFSSIKICRYK
jgi:hypothetical protein